MMSDLFSKQAKAYSQYRPKYPPELYQFISAQCIQHDYAWDCATGNGQAALALSHSFRKVLATDLSEEQIKIAPQKNNITYQVGIAEDRLDAPDLSFDLITIAQALHWPNLKLFYEEVMRVLKPDGIFAAWGYSFHAPISPEIDKLLNEFYFKTLEKFWKPNNHLLWEGYKTIPFPFEQIETPKFKMNVTWSLVELMGYFSTWSATQLYKDQNHSDPVMELYEQVKSHWGDPEDEKLLSWELSLRIGRKR
jgi:ubiquinone/menaquinone biosynthesis C-methylase UbiE